MIKTVRQLAGQTTVFRCSAILSISTMAGAVVPTLLRVPSATSGPLLACCGMDRNCTNERVVRTCRTNGRSEVSLLGRAAASSRVGGRKEGRTLRVMSTMSAKGVGST